MPKNKPVFTNLMKLLVDQHIAFYVKFSESQASKKYMYYSDSYSFFVGSVNSLHVC